MKIAAAAVPAALVLGLVLGGCASKSPRFFTLAEATPAPVLAQRQGAAPIAIALAPVALPERLARPQLVVRRSNTSQAELEILEQSRWSSSFENELRDALGAGIAARLGALDATKAGGARGQPLYRIAVQLRQFDAVEGGRVESSFGWTLRRADEDPLPACQLTLSEPAGSGVDALALAAQRITGRLADAIARNVASLAAQQPVQCPAQG